MARKEKVTQVLDGDTFKTGSRKKAVPNHGKLFRSLLRAYLDDT